MSDQIAKARMTVWVDRDDRQNMAEIRRAYRLASDSAAIRYALQRVAQMARSEAQR